MLEDDLLSRLSSASGDFLGDTALVENLETTKQTAAEVEKKVKLCWQPRLGGKALLPVPESCVWGGRNEVRIPR